MTAGIIRCNITNLACRVAEAVVGEAKQKACNAHFMVRVGEVIDRDWPRLSVCGKYTITCNSTVWFPAESPRSFWHVGNHPFMTTKIRCTLKRNIQSNNTFQHGKCHFDTISTDRLKSNWYHLHWFQWCSSNKIIRREGENVSAQ